MAIGSINWYAVLPQTNVNLVRNPSLELGATDWTAVNAGTIAQFSGSAAYGAQSLMITAAAAASGAGANYRGTVVLGNGTSYMVSCWAKASDPGGVPVRLFVTTTPSSGEEAGAGSATIGTAWQQIRTAYTEAAGANRGLALVRNGYSGTGTIWIDGAQVQLGAGVETYLDGEQDGCQWTGNPHQSTSFRDAQTRAGGSVVALAAIGMRPNETPGIGMAPLSVISQPYAVLPGEEYQRSRATMRGFTLSATLVGTTMEDLHVTRRRVIDLVKPDRVATPQPVRFLFTGAGGGTVRADGVYREGLEDTRGPNDVINESVAIGFAAPDPAWYGMLQEGTSLAPYTILGSANYVAWRDPAGRWGTMTASVNNRVRALGAMAGTVFAGGDFTSAGGTQAVGIAQWSNGQWGTLGPGTLGPGRLVYALLPLNGTVFVGGEFEGVAGTNGTAIARWTGGGWGTVGPGLLRNTVGNDAIVHAMAVDYANGFALYVGGLLETVAGTVSPYIARWTGAAWGTLTGGTIDNQLRAIITQRGTVFVGGINLFAGGTVAPRMAHWTSATGAWGTMLGGTLNDQVNTLASGLDLSVYAGINNGDIAGITYGTPLFQYRGGSKRAILGLRANEGITSSVHNIYVEPDGGLFLASANIGTINGVSLPSQGIRFNGYSYVPSDLIVGSASNTLTATRDGNGTMYIGGVFTGIGTAASVTAVVNTGQAEAYPVIRLVNTGNAPAPIYQLLNTTTGDDLFFSLTMNAGEYAILDLTPGSRSFTSNQRGNLISAIVAGSNLATWRLLPGTNTVSFLANSANVQADIYWTPRHWSADGGARATL